MTLLLNKIILKAVRKFGGNKLMKIRAGVLKGYRWSVAIPDSRYLLGSYEEDLSRRIQKQVKEGKRLVDIGANAGYFSLIAARNGKAEINHIAVEPFPANVQLLQSHLKENNISNVLIEEIAIADKSGEIEFSNTPNLAANTYKSESSIFSKNVIKVRAEDLDSFSERHHLDSNCLIKIDVEGAEFDVLKGGKNFLQTHHPNIVLATHDCHVKGVRDDCLNFLNSIGYSYEVLEDEKIDGQEDFFCYSEK